MSKDWYPEVLKLRGHIKELETQLAEVSELPVKWLTESIGTGITPKDGDAKNFCAYELQAIIKREKGDE